jgi:hypothetical protein
MTSSNVVSLYGNLSPLEEHFRRFDMGKANWSTSDYINYSTTKVSPHFLKQALIEDFKQRFKEKNNVVMYIYGTQGSGKSLLGICIGRELGKIFGRPLDVKNIGFFENQFVQILKDTEKKDTLLHDEEDDKQYGALSTYFQGEVLDAMFRNRALQQNYIFTSPMEGEKGQFITIDVKNTRKVNGLPVQIEALLYTSWYNDSMTRVCRGVLVWDVTKEDLDFYSDYATFKNESLEKIRKDLGGNFDIVKKVSKNKFEELKDKLIVKPKGKEKEYKLVKGAYFGDIIEIEGDIGKYTRDVRQKIIRAAKVLAINEITLLNQEDEE